MFKKLLFTISLGVLSLLGYAQKNINEYKYIIIPTSFEFSKSEDQYQLNSLTKFLFNKYGYDAYFINELPEDLKKERCLGLRADVSNAKSGMFKTKVEITLKDCYDVVVMTSKVGDSRLKEYGKAYNEAIREAFETFQNMDYKYVAKQDLVETIKEESQPVMDPVNAETKPKVVDSKQAPVENSKEVTTKVSNNVKSELYYAQSITNGYQLVNSEPKVVMILLNSSAKDVFIVKDKNAIVFKKEGQWIYSENNGRSASQNVLNIKF
ncbi:hypothetical protein [Winogradskyella sp. PC D3.3]